MNKKKPDRKFKQLVILDPIILTSSQWYTLAGFADSLYCLAPRDKNHLRYFQEKTRLPNLILVDELNNQLIDTILKESDAIITCWTSISDDLILSNHNLCYIGFWTHCIDGKINIKLAREKDITVIHIPDYGTDAVAEMTIAGILTIHRKILRIARDVLRGKWQYEYLKTGIHIPDFEEIPARSLTGKLLGIVGFGRIGQRVAEIALTFKMHVQYYSTSRHLDWESKGVRYVELDELFSSSDIISIHLPQNAPSKMIDRELIRKMKDGNIFVNTSAGRLVDQEALFEEIKSGRIYTYLDVYEGLPPRKTLKELDALDNLFTYRAAWFTKESVFLKGEILIKDIGNHLENRNVRSYVEKP